MTSAPNSWDADIAIDSGLAHRLLTAQFPQLLPLRLTLLGVGWDNVAFLVNDGLVFRFPRRRAMVRLMEQEIRILPLLAPGLPLPIPAPKLVGSPTPEYPYSFAGYPMIDGATACRANLTDEERCGNATVIARFLAALHGQTVDAETREWAPNDQLGRADLPKWLGVMRERAASLPADVLPSETCDAALSLAESLSETPPRTGPTGWVHGDLYARHLLVDDSRRINGIIDWGDVHLGDPALDLSIAFAFLPPEGRRQFHAAYGEIDKSTWDRARFRALHNGFALLVYGRSVGDPAIADAGAYALRNAVLPSV
jgi:aminoglycoside phosphotransferase (APT) family kinase protein